MKSFSRLFFVCSFFAVLKTQAQKQIFFIEKVIAYDTTFIDTTLGHSLYKVSLANNIKNNTDTFFIPDYGYVTKKDTVRFLSFADTIRILNKKKNKEIEKLLLKDNIAVLQGDNIVMIPSVDDFDKQNYRSIVIKDFSNFRNTLIKVISRYFISPKIIPFDATTVFITPYHRLKSPELSHVRGYCSLKMEFFFASATEASYRISVIIKQNTDHAHQLFDSDDESFTDQSKEFLEQIINEINGQLL